MSRERHILRRQPHGRIDCQPHVSLATSITIFSTFRKLVPIFMKSTKYLYVQVM